jgi:hypothetical protein
MSRWIAATALALALAVGCGGGGGSSVPPDPPGDDATLEETEEFLDAYNEWLEDCGSLERCARIIENDARYDDFETDP